MEGEMMNFVNVCLIVIASLTYCYLISSRIPKGKLRFLSLLPVITIFTFLPLLFSSVFLQFFSGLYIGWLSNFKLLLFAFGRDGTLFAINPSVSILHFIVIIALPVRVKVKQNKEVTKTSLQETKTGSSFAINVIMWFFTIQMYVHHKQRSSLVNPIVIRLLYSFRMFYSIQIQLVIAAAIAKLLLGEEIEPQFDDVFMSTSLQNCWGKRWNCYVSSVLKTSIHEPTRTLLTPILGRRWALHPAILATFIVSGLMHELIHVYVGRRWPTWEVLWYFIIHGVCVAIEVEVKKSASRSGWKNVSRMISTPLVFMFFVVTGCWLCYAELVNWGADQREVEEYAGLLQHVKDTYKSLSHAITLQRRREIMHK